jgi:Fungal specific transcription factor domain
MERGLECGYEPVKPRKRRRSSFVGSALSADGASTIYYGDDWQGELGRSQDDDYDDHKWEVRSAYQYDSSDVTALPWDDDAEELVRMEPGSTIVRSRGQYPDLAMIAPCPMPSPLHEFGAPLYMEFAEKKNRRALVDHFCNVLSHLIVFKEDTGNPFRQLVLPLSHASPPVMNAIYALSSAHLEYRGIENEEKSLDFHNNALQGLAMLIDKKDKASREEVLAAIMLLVYYEVVSMEPSCSRPIF